MERIPVNGGTLEGESLGSGEPVLLIHGSVLSYNWVPLLKEKALASKYRLINYHRRGFAGSVHHTGPFSLANQAEDARAVLKHFAIERAHVVGHSYGGSTALQLALDAPEMVHSLALLDPGILHLTPAGPAFLENLAALGALLETNDRATVIDQFMQMAVGEGYRPKLDRTLPTGWFEQAVADSDTFFQVEVPAILAWDFSRDAAKRINVPTLSVLGAESGPDFREIDAVIKECWPETEAYVLPNATHGLQYMNPGDMAPALAAFFGRHPL